MRFLGSCDVCGRAIHNYRGLAGHLRHKKDPAHLALREAWQQWKLQFRVTLRCRKCGTLWETTERSEANRKNCPRCRELKRALGKQAYERVQLKRLPGVEVPPKCLQWEPGDTLYQQVVAALEQGDSVLPLLRKLSLSYKVFRAISEHALGREGYRAWSRARKAAVARRNIQIGHDQYKQLKPEEKAQRLAQRFRGTCALEAQLAEQLRAAGVQALEMNCWQSIPVAGSMVPREADIKVSLGSGRKLVLLCDGEAFHGPRAIFNPERRVQDDIATAQAYFALGYSVARYSETEIKSGQAVRHLCERLPRMRHERLLRTWHPLQETWV